VFVDSALFSGTVASRLQGVDCTPSYGQSDYLPVENEQAGEVLPANDEVLIGPIPTGQDGVLSDGTVYGGTPCKSIFEVLIAQELSTARAILQVPDRSTR
jgi:hypothetical protein